MFKKYDYSIEKCGLFVDLLLPFIGATPDGLLGDRGQLEVKCSYAADRDGLTPQEAA